MLAGGGGVRAPWGFVLVWGPNSPAGCRPTRPRQDVPLARLTALTSPMANMNA